MGRFQGGHSGAGPMALAGLLALALQGFGPRAQAMEVTGSGELRSVPAERVVEEGDTLFSICEDYFTDGWKWPGIWALNPQITNPHWIYPGDIVRLRSPDGAEVQPGEVVRAVNYTVGATNASQVSLNEGFISEEEMKKVGTLKYSTEVRRFLSEGNPVYLSFEHLDEVRVGQQYSVYKVLNDVVHPQTDEVVGQKINVLGIVEIDSVEENVARGHITSSYAEIERGMKLTPLLPQRQSVSPKQNLLDLTGVIVDSFREVRELGQFHLAYVDKGSKDGVQIGNRLFVLRRGDGKLELDDDVVEKLPWEQVGELLVVETRDHNSTVLITRAARELKVGDRVQMQRNY